MKTYFLFVLAFFCCSLNFICNGAAKYEPLSKTVELQNKCNLALDKFLLDVVKYFKSNAEKDFDLSLEGLENLLKSCDELNKLFNVKLSSTLNIQALIIHRRSYKLALNLCEDLDTILNSLKLCDEQLKQYLNRYKVYALDLNSATRV